MGAASLDSHTAYSVPRYMSRTYLAIIPSLHLPIFRAANGNGENGVGEAPRRKLQYGGGRYCPLGKVKKEARIYRRDLLGFVAWTFEDASHRLAIVGCYCRFLFFLLSSV